MIPERHTWRKGDWITAALTALISFAVYFWSAAPNVTLLDSGEFLVAAQHFGVPHPTGYPLWTLLTWAFLLLPLGNAAWEVALCSGFCAALACGVATALISSVIGWCFPSALSGRTRFVRYFAALAFGLMLAFSESMWSQAVIAEVYALHALLTGLFLLFCYAWVRTPSRDGLMLGAFFILSLSFSNHQLTMVMGALPYLLILLLRRRMFLDWLFAGILTLLLVYLGFAILSKDPAVLRTAIRFFYCVALALGVFVWLRRLRVRWRLIAFLPFVVAAGLLPYAYMPFASSTNPPMNWGYARDPAGFYFSVNRSQYPGSLSEMTVKSLGRLMGTAASTVKASEGRQDAPFRYPLLERAQLWTGFFWQQLMKAFSPLALIGYFASFLLVLRLSLPQRTWIYFLHISFVIAMFLQPMTADTTIDNGGWWTQMPYHTYTNVFFAILAGFGVGMLILRLGQWRSFCLWAAPALLVLPALTFYGAERISNQRGHWFGWMFGHDMLKDLPKGSIVIGGTDPGRFVPTYMIFGESPQPAKDKRDPDFDRRDLYIITQNALGEPNYMNYLRDQYTDARPPVKNGFERWLGRDTTYPKENLILPTQEEISARIKRASEDEAVVNSPEVRNGLIVFSEVLKWIWEHNRDKHDFYVEESFPLTWTYDYAIPHGLIYKLNKTKIEKLSQEDVDRDFAFWKEYKQRLLSDPAYLADYDAQRSFSKLRLTMGNLYRHRKMDREAERAYREAIELWPASPEAIVSLLPYLTEKGEFNEMLKIVDRAISDDPNNLDLLRLRASITERQKMEGEIIQLTAKLANQPRSGETLRKLVQIYTTVADTNKAGSLVQTALTNFPDDADMMRFIVGYYERVNALADTLEPARRLTTLESSNVDNYLLLARAYFVKQDKTNFYATAQKAVDLGGQSVREGFRDEDAFAPWKGDPEFQRLTAPPLSPKQPVIEPTGASATP